ncbi:CdaR family transcriptional regulator [Pseudomonas mediterranea]|uniref:Transcriptional regulator, CdaR family n=1 Tax=Pseudomonas mediterranea TaxID=183795 RepID=A0AAX2DC50_9PSED|nr:sugar diacid recognition domain-containing protein [Pseudomonas mediterranea]KGU86167.1 CdaR family transcriptional regulator [Pseudomonas mediterranea CFBP 5447]MBL0842825.1 helix-turn-helix domain-containing protein [Pseudomonas mediterranea]QHA83240.1 CdaR family transcriptional regulator [Pseudomonas mediterranea]CAH0318135.1 Carbohydrate diacid regulator [Pseudomonas mediterranea]SDU52674.1 transcriptional regulator, CdaR family [Pseudomonas mediterranea]
MFELDHDLAQDIVDRAMAILPYNVNVMDNQGLILGSGERERINTRHEGAQLVLANGRVVEIDAHTALQLKGVQPGINLPLMLDQRLIGVLGITGEPEQLRTYAELVRMTAEMLLGQRNQQAEQQWRRQRCDDLLALLLGDAGDSPRLLDEARQMGLKPQLSRVPYLFELGLEHGPGQTVEALSAWLMSRYPDSWCLTSSKSSLLWCRPVTASVENERLLGKLDGLGWNILRVAVGGQAEGLAGLRRCYRRVGDLLAYGRDVLPQSRLLTLNRYRLPVLLWRHRDDDALDELLTPLRKVIAKDSNGQLLATLRSWCEHDGQSQACAEALGIHRNSLRYRMERIAELSGVDPLRLDGMLALYLGIQLLPQTESPVT